jgi:hypothetical protein
MKPLHKATREQINFNAHGNTAGEGLAVGHMSAGAMVEAIFPALQAVASKALASTTKALTADEIFSAGTAFLAEEREKARVEAEAQKQIAERAEEQRKANATASTNPPAATPAQPVKA